MDEEGGDGGGYLLDFEFLSARWAIHIVSCRPPTFVVGIFTVPLCKLAINPTFIAA